jgi:replicative DNA helicase
MTTQGERLVFTPIESSNATEQHVKDIRANDGDGMPLYIPSLDYSEKDNTGFLPVKRGEIIMTLGRPGSGKTGFMLRWARARANALKRKTQEGNELAENSVVLYLTMEQLVEELRLFHVSAEEKISATRMANGKLKDEEWDVVNKSLRGMYTTPLWFAGKSMARRKDKIRITEQTTREVLDVIEKWQGDNIKTQIDCVFIDYLQRYRSTGAEWVQFYGDLTNALKDMASDFATRMIVGVQARREVDGRDLPIPREDDGQWTSAIEQQADGMLSVVRPSHYRAEGETWDKDGDCVIVKGHNQMLISVLKRKLGPANFKGWVSFEPEYNKLDTMEMKSFNPQKDIDDYRQVNHV